MSKQSDVTGLFNEGFVNNRGFTVTPVLVANQNDYDPPAGPNAFADVYLLQFSLGANVSITGLVAPALGTAHGRTIRVQNLSAFILTLTNQDAASAAANRFLLPNGQAIHLSQNAWVDLYYTSARWQVVAASIPRDLQTTRRVAIGTTACPTAAATVLGTFVRQAGERPNCTFFPVADNAAVIPGLNVVVTYPRTVNPNEYQVVITNTSGVNTDVDWTLEATTPTTP